MPISMDFDERAKASKWGVPVGFVGRLELHNRVVFAFHTEAGDGLATIDVENPQGNPFQTGDSRQETRKWPLRDEIVDDEAA